MRTQQEAGSVALIAILEKKENLLAEDYYKTLWKISSEPQQYLQLNTIFAGSW